MQKNGNGRLIYSPSDLIRFYQSPFASWMDRWHLEGNCPEAPDPDSEEQKLLAKTGDLHEKATLQELKQAGNVHEIDKTGGFERARKETVAAAGKKAPVIYQAALGHEMFAGYADFLFWEKGYEVWDTKLAKSPKPYYTIQLCCYSEMLAKTFGADRPKRFGVILGDKSRVTFQTEDFFYLYLNLKEKFLRMHLEFDGDPRKRPQAEPRAENGRWSSLAERLLRQADSLSLVAGITLGQIRKLEHAGIKTVADLAKTGAVCPKIPKETFEKIKDQAELQHQTRQERLNNPEQPPLTKILPVKDTEGRAAGLATLPPARPGDIFFDMEGYPLVPGGLEYLFGAQCEGKFHDWWAHDRQEEKKAFQDFVDWAFKRWKDDPQIHIYHYANYEVAALRRLSNRHEVCQQEMKELLSKGVFVDLYRVVRSGLRVGEESYSIKKIESLYRKKRETDVATAVDSIVHYSNWLESGQGKEWTTSGILKGIRDYNEDDCRSTKELADWLRNLAEKEGISFEPPTAPEKEEKDSSPRPEVAKRLEVISELEKQTSAEAKILGHLLNFHRREEVPVWWRMFDRAASNTEDIYGDSGCIQGLGPEGTPEPEKQSLVQRYRFNPDQEIKLKAGDRSRVSFCHNLSASFQLKELDIEEGILALKISQKKLAEAFDGSFPQAGSILEQEHVPATPIQLALTELGQDLLGGQLPESTKALLNRLPPSKEIRTSGESKTESALRVAKNMNGGCFVIQGPPGTGKTHTGAKVILRLLQEGKKIGITSNSHKAINHLMKSVGELARADGAGTAVKGIKVESEPDEELYDQNPGLRHIDSNKKGKAEYQGGLAGGTAWLFTDPAWKDDRLDYLFVDEAGQFSLANAVAVSRAANNLVLLGDQMQLEQPVQGSHQGAAGLSVLQYVLLDESRSVEDAPFIHPVVPDSLGLFLDQTHRLPEGICKFISESIYDGRLTAAPSCGNNCLVEKPSGPRVTKASGILYLPAVHEGNVQKSEEEAGIAKEVFKELCGKAVQIGGKQKLLQPADFLFITPYNAQVRLLKVRLGPEARVGSVDKFQGQQAPICIFSMCSSFGEYGHRGLGFILDKNRVNVALSRAQVLAVVIGDPRIINTPTESLSLMHQLNLLCKISFAE